ncbi:MAG: hypothetical protein JF588_19620 [Caulobacterales bacterium]|nr:hypothetical protein [Caulobacterales bacterium]
MTLALERTRDGLRASEPQAPDAIVRSARTAERRSRPFAHWRLADVLPQTTAEELARLPLEPSPAGGDWGQRERHNDTRRYLAGEMLDAFPAARAVACAFQAPAVVAALAALTGTLLAGGFLRIEYALDVDGFWLEPHTDLGVKLLTLLVQFPAPGQEGLGTDLYWDAGRWAERTPFAWNAALAFAPSDRTWHGFEPRPIVGVRRSLLVNYVSPAWRSREQLAFPDRPVGLG